MSGFLGAHALLFYCRLSLTYTIIDLGLIEMKRIFNIVSIIWTTTGLRLLLDLISIGKRALLLSIPSTIPKMPFPPFSWKGIRVSKPIRGFLGGKKTSPRHQNSISIASSVFPGFTLVTNKHPDTDRPRWMCSNRSRLMRCRLTSISCCRWSRETRCLTRFELYTQMDAQWWTGQRYNVVSQTSTVAVFYRQRSLVHHSERPPSSNWTESTLQRSTICGDISVRSSG